MIGRLRLSRACGAGGQGPLLLRRLLQRVVWSLRIVAGQAEDVRQESFRGPTPDLVRRGRRRRAVLWPRTQAGSSGLRSRYFGTDARRGPRSLSPVAPGRSGATRAVGAAVRQRPVCSDGDRLDARRTPASLRGRTGWPDPLFRQRETAAARSSTSATASGAAAASKVCCRWRSIPKYARNHRFYVNYTDKSGNTRVVEFRSRNGRGVKSTARQLLFVTQPFSNHNGGELQFDSRGTALRRHG